MSFLVSKITTSPLLDLQNNLTNPHENASTLGKPKLGLARLSFSLPFHTKNQSWPRKNALSLQTGKPNISVQPHQAPLKTSVLGQTQWHNEVSLESLQNLAQQDDTSPKHTLEKFDPIDHLQSVLNTDQAPSHEQHQQWSIFTNIARTPSAQELFQTHDLPVHKLVTLQTLSQIHHHFNIQSGQSRTLNNLIGEALKERNQHSIPHLALLDCVEQLSEQTIPKAPSNKRWATHAFRNGLLDQYAGSDFMTIDARLRKLGKWIERKEHKPSLLYRLIPTLKKSPFRSLKFGSMGADRGDIEQHRANYSSELKTTLSTLQGIGLTLQGNAYGLRKWVQEKQYISAKKALRKLNQLKNELNNTPEAPLHPKHLNHAHTTIQQLEKIKRFLPNNPQADRNPESPRNQIHKHIQQLKNIIGAKKTTGYTVTQINNDQHPQRTKVLGHLQHVVNNIQGAARWKMLSGGVFGLGTKGITTTFTSLMFGLLARLKIDLRWLHTRLAGVEIAMPAYNLELMLYTSTQTGKQMGIGTTVGPSVGIAELTAGGNIKAWASEQKHNEGVVLRMHRERGKEPKKQFNDMLARLFELSTQHLAAGETLKTLLAEFPELSTNLLGQSKEYKRQHAVSLEGNAGIVTGPIKLGPTAEVSVEYQSLIQKDQVDKTGFLKLERHVQGKGLRGIAESRFDVRFNAMRDPFRLTPLTLDNLAVSADFVTAGRQLRQDIVYHHNRISPVSFYEIEYQSFEDFKTAILSNKAEWNTAHHEKHKTHNDPVEHFLNQVQQNLHTAQTFGARWELKPETVDLINRYNTAIMLLEHSTDLGEQTKVNEFKQRVRLLLNDPQSYKPTSFRIYERKDVTETTGLHLAARLEAVNQAEGVYTHSRLM